MRQGLRKRIGEVVVLQLGNAAVKGVLIGVYRDVLELADPFELGEQADVKLDGHVMVPRDRVAYVQFGGRISA